MSSDYDARWEGRPLSPLQFANLDWQRRWNRDAGRDTADAMVEANVPGQCMMTVGALGVAHVPSDSVAEFVRQLRALADLTERVAREHGWVS